VPFLLEVFFGLVRVLRDELTVSRQDVTYGVGLSRQLLFKNASSGNVSFVVDLLLQRCRHKTDVLELFVVVIVQAVLVVGGLQS
jgi:hypothetical protein